MSNSYERVYTVTDYWDGPIGGVADFKGAPHRYQAEFDTAADEYSSVFRLQPIPQEVFGLLLEDWAIWQRWETAFRKGAASHDTRPALPSDRRRHEEVVMRIVELEKSDSSWPVRVSGTFRLLPKRVASEDAARSFEVQWGEVKDA